MPAPEQEEAEADQLHPPAAAVGAAAYGPPPPPPPPAEDPSITASPTSSWSLLHPLSTPSKTRTTTPAKVPPACSPPPITPSSLSHCSALLRRRPRPNRHRRRRRRRRPLQALHRHQPLAEPVAAAGGDVGSQNSFPLSKPTAMPVLDSAGAAMAGVFGGALTGKTTMGFGGGDGALSSIVTCQDCGNKAKKDCSRGFDCPTHVRSTWVSAAQRRERHVSSSAGNDGGCAGEPGSSASTSTTKKPRLVSSNDQGAITNTTSTSNTTTPLAASRPPPVSKVGLDGLPGQVTAPAVFKCVRVTNMEDGEDEYAYQAMVRISGHIFKGFLYDQGPAEDTADAANDDGRGNSDTNNRIGGGIPNISELHLGGYGRGGGASDLYAAGLGGGLMGGTPYGKPMN
ncbi:unnamed protein product [Spirodela intermedia]|uniref:Uncharacterized protein n=1 Tax=Spirodela intermedia TaxID=51605 RepID=A0A7I8I9C0_SPIIN|nr:unnamed protein product [Spirodela intermedia]CAA6654023.1 unnamed protein product [Spirodela intermedia]